jgi:eukaryotic-like serine/threonine-protein kinase
MDTERLRAAAGANEDPEHPMANDDARRPERATAPSRVGDTRSASPDTRATIEQRYEVEATLAGLELEDQLAVPIGPASRFLLRKRLGHGSMGTVYLADDVELERRVAIKVVARRIEHDHLVLRLRREARALAALDHPNVVKIFDLGTEHDEIFLAMEYVAGENLRAWQRGRSLGARIEAYLHAGRGLAAAHARGIIHRDFKPDNVLVDEASGRLRVRVGDFGLAGDEPDEAATTEPTAKSPLTSSKGLLGTIPYMAPEQLRQERADSRSDQHQYCVALWEAVAGQRPFDSLGRPLEGDTSVPARPPAMPRWVHRVLRRGLAFARDERYPSMDALLTALERGRAWRRSVPWLALGGLTVVLASGVWALQPDPCEGAASPMASIWTPEARLDIETAFGPRDAASGSTAAGYLVGRLDEAAAGWSDRAREVCEAREHAPAVESPTLERRQTCLDRWADRMQRRIEWLRHPDEARMTQAFELVEPLGLAASACAVPPIIIDTQVDEALEQAEQAELLRDLDGARALANAAVELARIHGTPCVTEGPDGELRSSELSAALFRLGHVLGERGESEASLDALTRAHLHAYACNDEHRDADARIHAAKVLAADLEDVDTAATALDDAWVALRHIEEPATSLRRYDERMAAGIVAEHRGDYEAARRHAEEGRTALGERVAPPILDARLVINIGVAFHKEGRYVEAAEAYAQATALVASALGRRHPQARLYAARQALNLGLAAQDAGDHGSMRRHFEEATASSEPAVVAKALTAWAQAEYSADEGEVAAARTAQLLAFLGRGPELPPIILATAEATAGQILFALDHVDALAVLEQACAHWREIGTPPEVASCELSLAAALHQAGRRDDARRLVEHMRSLELDPQGPLVDAIEDFARTLDPEPGSPGTP